MLVQHIVLDGSLDAQMVGTLIAKQAVADAALDHGEKLPEVEMFVIPEAKEPAVTREVTVQQVAEEAVKIAPAVVQAVHLALQMLSGVCDGARDLDGAGFNRLDTRIGKSLAMQASLTAKQAVLGRKIVQKYHRQLPADLLEVIKGHAA